MPCIMPMHCMDEGHMNYLGHENNLFGKQNVTVNGPAQADTK